ncbi:MAG: MBL fold metallo-hydrolase [Planctomycetaceae bacterium]|nr:MBL fold metallo-hydrolase [Planctomycetaceae bacterium]
MKTFHRLALITICLLLATISISVVDAWFIPTRTTVTELAPGVFFRKTQNEPEFIGCNQGWVVFKDFVLVIDANFPNQAEKVIKLIRKHTNKPIRYVFDTHYHGDHADGNEMYVRLGATAVASARSKAQFETKGVVGFEKSQQEKPGEYGKLPYRKPSLYFPNRLVFDDGTQRVELIHFGHAHTLGDAVAWLPKHQILFTGDACVNGAFNYTGDSNTESWITVLNQMEELPIKVMAPGHGELGDKKMIQLQRRYFVELRAEIRKAIKAGKALDQIKQEIDLPFYEQWTGVDVKTRTENIEHVYQELGGK